MVYDPVGNVVAQTDGLGNVTRFIYDDRNRVNETILPDGSYTTATYNGLGATTSQTDELGRTTLYTYNQLGQETSVQLPATIDATSDAAYGDHIAQQWNYTYDAVGDRITEQLVAVDFDQLDPMTGMPTVTDQGRTTQYYYDSLGEITKVVDPSPADPISGDTEDQPVHTFEYDPAGNLHSSKTYDDNDPDVFERTTTSYDGLNRQVSVTNDGATILSPGGSPTATAATTTNFSYDSAGNLTSVQDPRGKTTRYGYDALNQRIEEIDPDPHTNTIDPSLGTDDPRPDILYSYDNMGNIKVRTLQQYGGSSSSSQTTEYDYDSMNRLVDTKQHDFGGTSTAILVLTTLTYDLAGNVTSTTIGASANDHRARPRDSSMTNAIEECEQ